MIKEEKIYDYLSVGEIDKVEAELNTLTYLDERLMVLKCLVEIYNAEIMDETGSNVFEYSKNIDVLYRWYTEVRLYIKRLDFNLNEKYENLFYRFCQDNRISVHMLGGLISHNIINKEEVAKKLIRLYARNKGEKSMEVRYLAVMLGNLKKMNWNRGND